MASGVTFPNRCRQSVDPLEAVVDAWLALCARPGAEHLADPSFAALRALTRLDADARVHGLAAALSTRPRPVREGIAQACRQLDADLAAAQLILAALTERRSACLAALSERLLRTEDLAEVLAIQAWCAGWVREPRAVDSARPDADNPPPAVGLRRLLAR